MRVDPFSRSGHLTKSGVGNGDRLELPSLLLELEMKLKPSPGPVALNRRAECRLSQNALRLRAERVVERIRRELSEA